MAPQSILIIGCGVSGPTLASLLLSDSRPAVEKPRITILERSSSIRIAGQNVDVRGEGVTVIRQLGIESIIRAHTTNEEGVHFVDSDNRIWAEAPADKTGQVQTGTSDIEILRGRLAQICYDRCRTISEEVRRNGGHGVDIIFGETAREIVENGDGVDVVFKKSKKKTRYDLVIGADGLGSQTRQLVWQPETDTEHVKLLGMYSAFFSIPSSATDSLWRRWYFAPGRRSIMIRPSETKDQSTVLMSVISDSDHRFTDAILEGRKGLESQKLLFKEYFQNAGWETTRLMREMDTTNDFYYSPVAQVHMSKWSKGRVVLLGDAGYCASPISGMGTTLGLTGAYHLAGAILQHGRDYRSAFESYEAKMRPMVTRAQKLAPGMPRLLHPQSSWGVLVLYWLVYLFDRSHIGYWADKFAGPPTSVKTKLDDYGFQKYKDMINKGE